MNTAKTCPQCGNELPANTVRGLCPKCLALLALGGDSDSVAARSSAAGTLVIQLAPATHSPQAALDPTLRYFGDYELLEEIARGGMGVVFKARQVSLNRIVAVKMILSGQLANENEVKRFHTEAEAAASLQHPNIVAIHEVGQHERLHYFSMDFVEGKNLAAIVRDGPFTAIRAAQLVKTIAEAIQYAHQRGVLHRDLKPQNILVDQSGRPRVTDFGLAKRQESAEALTMSGAVMGSPSYMSPEQAQGKHELVGPQSDLYSLGAVLYELLTARPPFRGETPLATLTKVVDEEPTPPRKLNPMVPQDLESICLKCLEKRPERRYSSARELAADLERFLNHEPVVARPASIWRRSWSWLRRHPWALVLAMAAGLVLLLGTVFWLETENAFLRFSSTHPGYVKQAGPVFKRVGPVLESWMTSTLFGAILCVACVYSRLSLRVKAVLPPWIIGTVCLAHGLVLLRRAVEAHIWQGESLAIPSSLGFVLLYLGIYLLVDGVRGYHRAELARGDFNHRPFAEFRVGLAELRRLGFKAFWQKQADKSLPPAMTSRPLAVPWQWQITKLRVFNALWMATLAVGAGDALSTDQDQGNIARSAFIMFAIMGSFCNGLYWAVKGGQTSRAQGTLSALGVLLFGVIITAVLMTKGWAGHPARSVVLQVLLGMVLGLAASFQLVRWKKEKKES